MRYARKVKFVTLSVKGVAACTRCKAMDSRVLLAFLCLVVSKKTKYYTVFIIDQRLYKCT